MSTLVLDAQALYRELLRGVRQVCSAETRLVGVASGGAWLAERLQRDLGLPGQAGVISSAMHRDDFARRGLANSAQTRLPFDVNGAHILVLDDVLYTGAPCVPSSTNCSTMAARPASGWRCWWTGAGVSCRCRPTLLQPGWRWQQASHWRWRVRTTVYSAWK